MADEATVLEVNNLEYRQATVTDGSAFTKGAVMVFTGDPNIVDGHRGSPNSLQYPAGILAVEKVASDGQTTVPLVVRGDVDIVASEAITLGQLVHLSAVTNRVAPVGAASVEKLGQIMGRCLETASAAEKVRVRLMLG